MDNRLLSIMFIDVQGFTKRTANQTRENTQLFIEEINSFVKQHLEKWQGTLVKTMGDGFLASFLSPTNAAGCGIEMQKKLKARNANVLNPDNFIRFRIGINTGEVGIAENGDLFGDPVNIAARIEGFAEPNEVFISEATFLAMNRTEFGTVDLGPQMFKNATREIRVYKILPENIPTGQSPLPTGTATTPTKKGAAPTQGKSPTQPWKWAVGGVIGTLLCIFILSNIVRIIKARKTASKENSGISTDIKTGGKNSEIPHVPPTTSTAIKTEGKNPVTPHVPPMTSTGMNDNQDPDGLYNDDIKPADRPDQRPDPNNPQNFAASAEVREIVEKAKDLIKQNKMMEAAEMFEKLIEKAKSKNIPVSPNHLVTTGLIYLAGGNKEKAENCFKLAVDSSKSAIMQEGVKKRIEKIKNESDPVRALNMSPLFREQKRGGFFRRGNKD